MLICLSASHKNAPFEVLEQLCAGTTNLAPAMVQHHESVSGAVVISTCNRFEAYLELGDAGAPPLAREAVTAAASAATGLGYDSLAPQWSLHVGADAVRHLFAVSSGLESVVVGEGEIAGQVKRSLESARAAGTTTPHLERLFQRASTISRDVKNRTPLGSAGRSIVRLALDLSEGRIAEWSDIRVLLVGTGAYAGAALAALRDRGVTDITIYSPSGRAQGFADSHGIPWIDADSYAEEAATATLVVTCTTAAEFVLNEAILVAGRHALHADPPPLSRDGTPGCPVHADATQVVIDLGLPRNVNPDVANVPGVDLLDLETIRIHAPLEEVEATDRAEVMVERATREFIASTDEVALNPAVVALRTHVHEILRDEIARFTSPDDNGVTEKALRHLTNRILHTPTVRAKEFARAGASATYTDALHALFGIAVPVAPDAASRAADLASRDAEWGEPDQAMSSSA